MKTFIYILSIAGILSTFIGCGKDEPMYSVPSAPVGFTINLNFQDSHLAGGGNIGVYLKNNKDKEEYDKLVSGMDNVKTYLGVRTGISSYIGYSGLLVVNTGHSLDEVPLAAFDLCCPYEDKENIRVVPTDNGTVVCPQCKSEYNIFSGQRLSGVTSENLQFYYVKRENQYEFRIYYP